VRLTLITYHLYLPECHSLKEKRSVLKGLKDKLKSSRLNISVAEVDHLDLWQRSTLAVAMISTDGKGFDKVAGAIDALIAGRGRAQILRTERSEY